MPDTPMRPQVEGGVRIYAIGDIHGRFDLLSAMADRILSDLEMWPCTQASTVFLGDYVDRGPDSAAVVTRLSTREFPTPVVFLRGNHETMLLKFLEVPTSGPEFFRNGGLETLYSYGVDVTPFRLTRHYEAASEAFRKRLPAQHIQFLRDTQLFFVSGDYFFCHAGVKPGRPLLCQDEADLLWIREPFLSSTASFGKIVVHGHTPVVEPEIKFNRINIDIGGYVSGRLACLRLEGDEKSFLFA